MTKSEGIKGAKILLSSVDDPLCLFVPNVPSFRTFTNHLKPNFDRIVTKAKQQKFLQKLVKQQGKKSNYNCLFVDSGAYYQLRTAIIIVMYIQTNITTSESYEMFLFRV